MNAQGVFGLMHHLIKKSRRFFLRSSSIISVIAIIFYGWLFTLPGLHLTLRGLSYYLEGTLSFEKATGSLAGPLHIKQLSYQSEQLQLQCDDFQIAFKKISFLKGKLHIKSLAVDKLNVTNAPQKSEGGFVDFVSILERFKIDNAHIKNCQFKTQAAYLMLSGSLGDNLPLQWAFEGNGLKINGEIKTPREKNSPITLSAENTPAILWGKQIPGLKMTAQYDAMHWSSHLLTTDSEKPVNEIKLSGVKTASSFLKREKLALQVHVQCKDFTMLEALGVPVGDYPLTQASGPCQMTFSLKDSPKRLKRYFKRIEDYLSGQYPHQPLPQQADLAIEWQAPHLLPWGVFKHLSIQGHLDHEHILWKAYVAEKTSDNKTLKWLITGETQCLFRKTKKWFRNFLSKRSLHAITHLKLNGDPLVFFKNTNYIFSAAPQVDITICNQKIKAVGEINMPYAQFKLTDSLFTIKPDPDIYFAHVDQQKPVTSTALDAQLTLTLGEKVHLNYGGLNARLQGALALNKKEGRPITAKGEIKIVEGGYYSLGQVLTLEKNARLVFTERLYNPSIDIAATRKIDIKPSNPILPFGSLDDDKKSRFAMYSTTDLRLPLKTKIGIHLKGDLTNPSMHLFAKPSHWVIDPIDRVSYLMTGEPSKHLGENPLALLLNTAIQLSYGYIHYHDVYDAFKPFGMRFNKEFEKGEWNNRLIFNANYIPETSIFWKIGRLGTSHSVGVNYRLKENILIGGNVGLYQAAHGCDISYQREWG